MAPLSGRQRDRKLAVADAGRKPLGVFGGRVFAVGRDKLAQRGEQRGLREAIAVDAVKARFAPSLMQITERDLLLLEIRGRIVSRIGTRSNRHRVEPIGGKRRRPSRVTLSCGEAKDRRDFKNG